MRGDCGWAAELYRRVIDIRRNAKPVNFNALVIALNNPGVIHQAHCRYQQACDVLEQAFEIFTGQLAGRHVESGRIQYRLGMIAAANERLSQAQQLFESALQHEAEIPDPENPRLLPIIDVYAGLLKPRQQPPQARQQRQRARQTRQNNALAPEMAKKQDAVVSSFSTFVTIIQRKADALPDFSIQLPRSPVVCAIVMATVLLNYSPT